MTNAPTTFDVRAERDHHGARSDRLYRVSITTNGYQWSSLPISIQSHDRAERIANFLRRELRSDALRCERETLDMICKGNA